MIQDAFKMLYFKSDEDLNISWIYPGAIQFKDLKTVFVIQYSTGSHIIFLIGNGLVTPDFGGKFR